MKEECQMVDEAGRENTPVAKRTKPALITLSNGKTIIAGGR